MGVDVNVVISIAIPLLSVAAMWGSITARLKNLEKKVDKHNGFMERLAKEEGSTRSAHHRLDELKDEICDLQHKQ